MYTPQGTKCDGSYIQRDSLCCEDDRYVKCPTDNCNAYTSKDIFLNVGKILIVDCLGLGVFSLYASNLFLGKRRL